MGSKRLKEIYYRQVIIFNKQISKKFLVTVFEFRVSEIRIFGLYLEIGISKEFGLKGKLNKAFSLFFLPNRGGVLPTLKNRQICQKFDKK